MSDLHYSLNYRDYTVKNALLWGNFRGHCALVMEGTWGHRIVHVGIAFIQLWPIISQIASLFEMLIVKSCLFNAIIDKKKLNGSARKVKKLARSEEDVRIQPIKLINITEQATKESASIPQPQLPESNKDEPGAPESGNHSPNSDDSFNISDMSSDSEAAVPVNVTAELQLVKARQDKEDNCLII